MSKKKILIIDDEEDFCYFIKKDLEMVGDFEVSYCSDSTKCLNAAKEFNPDIILLDVMMPNLSGPELVSILKSRKETKKIPVVYLSAFTTRQEKDPFLISKPVNLDELLGVIDNLTK